MKKKGKMLSPSVQSTLLQHAGLRLRQLMQRKCVMLPGTPNGIAARLAAEVGYEGLYISGAALSALQGLPDIGFLGLEEFTKAISQVSSVTTLPVMAGMQQHTIAVNINIPHTRERPEKNLTDAHASITYACIHPSGYSCGYGVL